jgi:hypothetical protein
MSRNRLVFLALCVLEEAADAAARGRVAPAVSLRLALAYLYAVGDRRAEWFDRQPYDEFWRVATQEEAAGPSAAAFGRSQALTAALNAIARAAGMERDARHLEATRRAREGRHETKQGIAPPSANQSGPEQRP